MLNEIINNINKQQVKRNGYHLFQQKAALKEIIESNVKRNG